MSNSAHPICVKFILPGVINSMSSDVVPHVKEEIVFCVLKQMMGPKMLKRPLLYKGQRHLMCSTLWWVTYFS